MECEQCGELHRVRRLERPPVDQRHIVHGSSDVDHELYAHVHWVWREDHANGSCHRDPTGTHGDPDCVTYDDQQRQQLHLDVDGEQRG